MEEKYRGNQKDKSNIHYINLAVNDGAGSDPNQISFTRACRDYYHQNGQNNNIVFQSRLDASSNKAEFPVKARVSPDEKLIKADEESGESRNFKISSAAKSEENNGIPYNAFQSQQNGKDVPAPVPKINPDEKVLRDEEISAAQTGEENKRVYKKTSHTTAESVQSFQSQWEFAGNGGEPLPGPVLSVSPGEVVLKSDNTDSSETPDDKRSYRQPPQVVPGEKIVFQSQWELSGNRYEPLPTPVRSVSESEQILKTDPNKTVIKRPEFYQPHGTYEFQSQISKSRQSVHNLQPLKPIPNTDEKVLRASDGKEEEAQKDINAAEKTKPGYTAEELNYTSPESAGRYSYSGRYVYSGRYENLNYTKVSVSDRYSSVNYTTERHYEKDKESREAAIENPVAEQFTSVQENTSENILPESAKADPAQADGLGLEYSTPAMMSFYEQKADGEEPT